MDTENITLVEALQKQVEALQSRIEIYKIQLGALQTQVEGYKIQLGEFQKGYEEYKIHTEEYKTYLEECKTHLEEKTKQVEALTKIINKTEEDKKLLAEKDKIFNYLFAKVKAIYPKRKTQMGTFKIVVRLAEYMLEKEIITTVDIKSHFGISRNTQWRYLQYIRPLGYFKYTRPDRIPTFCITEAGKAAKEEIKKL